MLKVDLATLADCVGGSLQYGGETRVEGVSIDTRSLQAGAVFFALKGTRYDGHNMLASAKAAGASAAVVERRVDSDLPQVVVENSKEALGELASWWRRQLSAKVIALTGSNGKTTVKEMLKHILQQHGATVATVGNLNNDLGLPLTVLTVDRSSKYAVLEMGASHFGEIDYMTAIARPDVALVNNVGAAHLSGFGDLDGVASAKGEIYDGLKKNGIAIINADDVQADIFRSACTGKRIFTFAMQNAADINGSLKHGQLHISEGRAKRTASATVKLKLLGAHNAMNALAATAVARALDIPLASIAKSLSEIEAVAGRLKPIQLNSQILLIDDTYNANPVSLVAGVQVAIELGGVVWLVLGELGELGENSAKIHCSLGEEMLNLGVAKLFCMEGNTRYSAAKFGRGAEYFSDFASLKQGLANSLKDYRQTQNLTILVKGSRSSRMERVVQFLTKEWSA